MKYCLVIGLLILMAPVIAYSPIQEVTASIVTILASRDVLGYNLEELKTIYNQNIGKVPWIVKKIIGNERINLYLTTKAGETIILGGITESARIIQVQLGKTENPTLNIYVTEEAVNKIKNKEITIEQALENKLVRYESQRVRTSIKIWLVNLFT